MKDKQIILGITGGIAAYKTPELVRRLTDRGAAVQVVMTQSAAEFVTSTALQAVSGRSVRDSLWDKDAEAAMGHIELARWADLVLIAPATAEFMSRLTHGSAADLLSTLCLATTAPVALAPAMNHVMWNHAAVQSNKATLEERGVRMLGPASGAQACGESGMGRMLETDRIAEDIASMFRSDAEPAAVAINAVRSETLAGRKVVITAGPTREAIDPVRYVSNRSSGKMGYALAAAASRAGANVTLISGPVALPAPADVDVVLIESAKEMFAATHERIDDADIFIAAAAVADYAPDDPGDKKIKKTNPALSVSFKKTPDILSSVARLERAPFTVGFAAETDRLREYAQAKLADKSLDMIVANWVGPSRGFDANENEVEVYWRNGEQAFPMQPKSTLAQALIELIGERYLQSLDDDTQTELPAISQREQ